MSLIILSYVYLKNVVDMRKIFYCKQIREKKWGIGFGGLLSLFLENRKKDIKCCEIILFAVSNQEMVKRLLLHPFYWNKVKADKLIYEGSNVDKKLFA